MHLLSFSHVQMHIRMHIVCVHISDCFWLFLFQSVAGQTVLFGSVQNQPIQALFISVIEQQSYCIIIVSVAFVVFSKLLTGKWHSIYHSWADNGIVSCQWAELQCSKLLIQRCWWFRTISSAWGFGVKEKLHTI